MKKIQYILFSLVLFTSCSYLDVEPAGQVIPDEISEFRAMLTTAYSRFPEHKKLLTVRSDEVFPDVYGMSFDNYISLAVWNDANPDPLAKTYPWTAMYNTIFYANGVIDGVMDAGQDGFDDTREQVKAEALLLRAYAHFELLNLYAVPYNAQTAATDRGIPLALEIDIDQQYVPSTIDKVYQQILSDIAESKELMQIEEQPAAVRYRFSKKSAKALEARVRLYRSEWKEALQLAEELLPSCPLENLNDSGAKDPCSFESKEAILAMEKITGVEITDDMYMLQNIVGLYNTDKDEAGNYRDRRLGTYLRYSYGDFKAKKGSDGKTRVTFRSSEIYLIAAEAAAHIAGKQGDAVKYLKQLAENRLSEEYYQEYSLELAGMSKEELISAVADERGRELVLEGHRWFDLRRTTRPEIVKSYFDANFEEQTEVLKQDDPRYTIRFPKEAVENNPDLGVSGSGV